MRKTLNTLASLLVGGLLGAGLVWGWHTPDTRTEYVPTAPPVLAVCQEEDGNPDGTPCYFVNDGQVWYVDSTEYSERPNTPAVR